MSFIVLGANYKGIFFSIEEDYPEAGSCLYIYEGEKCIKDYLQNDIEICKQVAFEDYEVPLDKWILKEND